MDYREKTKNLLDMIIKEDVLYYLWLLVADVAFEQGLLPESPFEHIDVGQSS